MLEKSILQKISLAWNNLDVSIIEPYIDQRLNYHSYYVNYSFYSKEEYISYLRRKFETISKSPNKNVKAEIVDENGVERVCLHSNNKDDILEVSIADGLIQKMLLRPPYTKFLFENFNKGFQELMNIAVFSLKDFINADNSHNWKWLQTSYSKDRVNEIVISYKEKVLSIVIGLFRKNIDGVNEYCLPCGIDNLLYECKMNEHIPCLFLIDSSGEPVIDGCHLIDARTFDRLCSEPLKEDSCESDNDKICVF